jgi:hypothetical protein
MRCDNDDPGVAEAFGRFLDEILQFVFVSEILIMDGARLPTRHLPRGCK